MSWMVAPAAFSPAVRWAHTLSSSAHTPFTRGGCGEAQVRGNGGRRAAGGAARHELIRREVPILALAPPRRDDRPEGARLVGGAHRELVAVELAEHDGAGIPQVGADGRLVGRL